MKRVIAIVVLAVILGASVLMLTGCTVKIETTENQVSASMDGDTTERVDSILDWIKARIQRVFSPADSDESSDKVED